jgi:hypothetical protein
MNLTPDEVLTTTRAVRKRLDYDRPVDPQLIKDCLTIALQAHRPPELALRGARRPCRT